MSDPLHNALPLLNFSIILSYSPTYKRKTREPPLRETMNNRPPFISAAGIKS